MAAELNLVGTSRKQCRNRDEVVQVFMYQVSLVTGERYPLGLLFPSICACLTQAEETQKLGKGSTESHRCWILSPGIGSPGHPLSLSQKLQLLFHHLQSKDNATCSLVVSTL